MSETEDVAAVRAGVRALLRLMGEDPDREGLAATPDRVIRAMREYAVADDERAVADLLAVTFSGDDYDELVMVGPVEFTSLCEHHLLPFHGTAHIAYIPGNGRVAGLSKLPRVLDHYAARPQMQERLTRQVANALDSYLRPQGVGVIVRASHTCMTMRGARKPGALMTTSAVLGVFLDNAAARAELFALAA